MRTSRATTSRRGSSPCSTSRGRSGGRSWSWRARRRSRTLCAGSATNLRSRGGSGPDPSGPAGRPSGVLLELRVENLLLIERAELRLGPGLTVLTGETGAGKTVLAHALDLLLGGRARPGIVRPGVAEAYVEGVFELPGALRESLGERLGPGAGGVGLARGGGGGGGARGGGGGRGARARAWAAGGRAWPPCATSPRSTSPSTASTSTAG